MALDSNRPLTSVHNDQNGIWEGAGWGLGAGAVATGMMYGATMHGTKHLQNLNMSMLGKKQGRLYEMNERNAAFGKKAYSEEVLQRKALEMEARAGRNAKMLSTMQAGGKFAFGSGKRAMIAGATGLLGGALIGGISDSLR
ncbi:hypothetical protein [Bacillus halotolerans]|uniref:Uncharacterized protein n=1 Tax=Bacillus halotolerans TaxID=260554 RepID=A0A9Q4ELP1_9BACI|nr:hypothetical protein [Bacillus halotolerans]MCY9186572.1 hypothetical protein [Bacillus halotolerans]